MSKFEFGTATQLYEEYIHPRVIIGPKDIDRLKESTRRGGGRRLMNAMREKVRPLVEVVLQSDDLPGLVADYNRSPEHDGPAIVGNVQEMALVGVLDDNTEAIEAARQVLLSAAGADPLSRNDHPCRRVTYLAGPFSVAYDIVANHLSKKDRRAYANWISKSAIPHILAAIPPNLYFAAAGANIPIYGMETAIPAILAVRGEPGGHTFRKELELLITFLQASLHAAIGADGFPVEDIGYGTSVAQELISRADMLRRAGIYDAWSEFPQMKKYGRAVLHFVQPWGRHMSNTGDFMDTWGNREFGLTRVATETNDPALHWLTGTLAHQSDYGTPKEQEDFGDEIMIQPGLRVSPTAMNLMLLDEFQKPVRPKASSVPTHFRDRTRGIVSFRSGWKDDDTLVVFDSSQRSPACAGHDHASAGNFTLSALGEYFGIDCGRYCNEQQEHNVVLINGKSGISHEGQWKSTPYAGHLLDYVPHHFCDFAAADSALQTRSLWARRSIGLVKGKTGSGGPRGYVWTVEDLNRANDLAEFWWTLNTHPDNKISIHKNYGTIHGCQIGSELDVHVALLPEDQFPDSHTCKFIRDTNTCRATAYTGDAGKRQDRYAQQGVHGSIAVRPRLIAKVKGWNGRFMSIMLPRDKGARPAKVQQLKTHYDAFAVKITFADVEDIIIWAYHHGLLEAADIKARGQWCIVRRKRKSRRLVDYALGHGTSLALDGKQLI